MFSFGGLDHIQLAAPEGSEAKARQFFNGILGWHEISKPEQLRERGGVWFNCGSHEVHIGVQVDFVPAVKAHPGILVNNLAALTQHLFTHNVAIIEDHLRGAEGIKRIYVNDPFGNRLEFLEREVDA